MFLNFTFLIKKNWFIIRNLCVCASSPYAKDRENAVLLGKHESLESQLLTIASKPAPPPTVIMAQPTPAPAAAAASSRSPSRRGLSTSTHSFVYV